MSNVFARKFCEKGKFDANFDRINTSFAKIEKSKKRSSIIFV